MDNKKWFYEKLRKEYIDNKRNLWKSLGGYIAFNYNYYEKINGEDLPQNLTTLNDLLKHDMAINISVTLMVEEMLKEFLNNLASKDDLSLPLKSDKRSYEQAFSESKKEDLSKKNFADFIWFVKEYEDEINLLSNQIIKDVGKFELTWLGLKYEKQGKGIYRSSPFRLAEINRLIMDAKEEKPKYKKPKLTLVSAED